MPIFNQTRLLSDVNARIKGKAGILVDSTSTLNQGVREVLTDIDLLSTRRRSILTPNLFNGIFEYAAPADLKGYSVITVQNQKWTKTPFWEMVPYEQFLRRQAPNTIAISDYDLFRKLFIKSEITDTKTTVSSLDSLSAGGGTWGVFGDADSLAVDSVNYTQGTASIRYDISAAGGTTAGLVNSTLTSTDLSGYFNGDSSCIVWAYITSTTNLTNFILRLGSDSSNYYSKTVTAQADGTALVNGWNILNFDLSTFDTTGAPNMTAATYAAIYMTKTAAKASEVGYRFDQIILRKGEVNNLYYYSSYGWQNVSGTYLANSTAANDYLNAGLEEYQMILAKCTELAAYEVDEESTAKTQFSRYNSLKSSYSMGHPSESLSIISTVADFVNVYPGTSI